LGGLRARFSFSADAGGRWDDAGGAGGNKLAWARVSALGTYHAPGVALSPLNLFPLLALLRPLASASTAWRREEAGASVTEV